MRIWSGLAISKTILIFIMCSIRVFYYYHFKSLMEYPKCNYCQCRVELSCCSLMFYYIDEISEKCTYNNYSKRVNVCTYQLNRFNDPSYNSHKCGWNTCQIDNKDTIIC